MADDNQAGGSGLNVNAQGTTNVYKTFLGQIETFVLGDDFKDYIGRMDYLLRLNKTPAEEKVLFLMANCGGVLYKIIFQVIAPKKPEEMTFDEIKDKLLHYFDPKCGMHGQRLKFRQRIQKDDENVSEFIVAIKSMTQFCEFGNFLDEAMRDQLIFGMKDQKMRTTIMNEKDLDFEKACEIVTNMEATRNASRCISSGEISALSRNDNGNRSVFSRLNAKPKSRFANMICNFCKKRGHSERFCHKKNANQNKKTRNGNNNVRHTSENSEVEDIRFINNVLSTGPVFVDVSTNGKSIKMEIDTGACESVISLSDKNNYFRDVSINKCDKSLFAVSGQINIVGKITVKVNDFHRENITHVLEFIVINVSRKFVPLMGRAWLDILFPEWRKDFKINSLALEDVEKRNIVETFKAKYPQMFSEQASEPIKNFKIHIKLKESAKPIFFRAYTVPYGLLDKVETEIKRLCALNIIYPVRHSDWASPIVIVSKSNGSIRICVDCKVTINKFLETDHYPLPRIDDILAKLSGATYFCILDLREAFQQMAVDEKSQEYLTINTHLGLFRFKRLVFGVSFAPTRFQHVMDQITQGLKFTICFIDDLLIGGHTLEECKQNLVNAIERLAQYNVKIRAEKCRFFEKRILYLGHEISAEGIRPNPDKIRAITNAPKPKDLQQLKSYLGLLNYYGRFIPNLSSELSSLYKLTRREETFLWSNECDESFERSKKLLLENGLLAHYDPTKEIILHCDASPYGLGAILSHKIDGKERPVLFVSCSLTQAQKNYAHLHREALAIVFAVKKFHKYIYGKKFTIYSDHQPLKEIFNEHKATPIAASRLQRWAIFLAMYDYKIVYKKGSKMNNADALSRLPLPDENKIESQNIHAAMNLNLIDKQLIDEHSKGDKILMKVYQAISADWKDVDSKQLSQYHSKKSMLSVEDNCIFYGDRLIIPSSLRTEVLKLLHDTHIGMFRMKLAAKNYVWWPGIDSDIEEFVKQCFACQSTQETKSPVALSTWRNAERFFERVHLDFFHFNQKTFLIVVDAFSKWFDVKTMKATNCDALTEILRNIFAYFGLPDIIVSDNGPPFSSNEFRKFCGDNGILCWKSPPYHPQSNGCAERGVRTVKQYLRKILVEGNRNITLELRLQNFLVKYRNTPVASTGVSPSEQIFIHRRKTLLDVLNRKPNRPNIVSKIAVNTKPEAHSESKFIEYELNEDILYKSEFKTYAKWIRGKIIEVLSKFRYKIKLNNGSRRECHADQLRKFNEQKFLADLPIFKYRKEIETIPKRRARRQRATQRPAPITARRASKRVAGMIPFDYAYKKPRRQSTA